MDEDDEVDNKEVLEHDIDRIYWIEQYKTSLKKVFGEHKGKAYKAGMQYTAKEKASLFSLIESTGPYGQQASDVVQRLSEMLTKSSGDSLAKDMAMVVLQPIGLAIEGSIQTVVGLFQVAKNIIPAIKKSKGSQMELAVMQTLLGLATLLLAAVAPLARLYNAATRAYATKVELDAKAQEALKARVPANDDTSLGYVNLSEANGQEVLTGIISNYGNVSKKRPVGRGNLLASDDGQDSNSVNNTATTERFKKGVRFDNNNNDDQEDDLTSSSTGNNNNKMD